MSPRKLTSSNKQEILDLYRSSPETTSTLADRYEVSSSTISRFLKSNLSAAEYEELIQQKRLGRTSNRGDKLPSEPEPSEETATPATAPPPPEVTATPATAPPPSEERVARQKAAPSPKPKPIKVSKPVTEDSLSEEPKPKPKPILSVGEDEVRPELAAEDEVDVATLQAMLGEDLADLEEEELEETEDDWEDDLETNLEAVAEKTVELRVLPLSAASFPRTCYLVIDRGADLITRPLKDFAELGSIPSGEVQQKTLPVFDNQRVARRFSNRSQRVIKVPDGRMMERTSPHLEAKGITRLFMDGKVYSLSAEDEAYSLR